MNERLTDNVQLDSFPLAMAYVPWQKWRDIYSSDVALQRGTLFAELDKPFIGQEAVCDEQ